MRRGIAFLSVIVLAGISISLAQSAPTTTSNSAEHGVSERKITLRAAPVYPDLARKAHLEGIVKIEAVVRPNGTVKTTRVLGGNPVLVQAATDAVNKWKFEATPNETTEVVQVAFVPQ